MQPSAGNGTCGSGTQANTLNGADYSGSYAYTHLGQQWQGPINGNGPQQQYLYCDSSHLHQLKGLYPIGTTCATSGSTTATYSVSYDSWGNVTSRTYAGTAATLSYNVLDQLVQWSGTNTVTHLSSGQQWSVYDASGQRVLQRSTIQYDTPLTVYAFGSDEHDYNATGQGTNSLYYYSLGGRLIGVLYGSETDALLTDAQSSVLSRMTTTAGSAAVKGNQVYSPYGSKLYSSGSMATNRGYTGQYKDATGLNYDNARYYDSVVGQFISADPVQGNAQGMDPYTYVNGNPETLTDPTGQSVSHCHEPGDCGPGSYTTNVSGGDTSGGGVISGQDGNRCTDLCDGPGPKPKNDYPQPQSGSGNPKIVSSTVTVTATTTTTTSCPICEKSKTAQQADVANAKSWTQVWVDGLNILGDVASTVIDVTAKNVGGLIDDAASIIAHIAAITKDIITASGAQIPSWLTNIISLVDIFVSIVQNLRVVLDVVSFFFGGGLVKSLADETKNIAKDLISQVKTKLIVAFISPNIVKVGGYITGDVLDFLDLRSTAIDNESPAQSIQWCQSNPGRC